MSGENREREVIVGHDAFCQFAYVDEEGREHRCVPHCVSEPEPGEPTVITVMWADPPLGSSGTSSFKAPLGSAGQRGSWYQRTATAIINPEDAPPASGAGSSEAPRVEDPVDAAPSQGRPRRVR